LVRPADVRWEVSSCSAALNATGCVSHALQWAAERAVSLLAETDEMNVHGAGVVVAVATWASMAGKATLCAVRAGLAAPHCL
jgi:hypothetical protein